MNALETILKMNEIALNEDLGKAGRAQAQLDLYNMNHNVKHHSGSGFFTPFANAKEARMASSSDIIVIVGFGISTAIILESFALGFAMKTGPKTLDLNVSATIGYTIATAVVAATSVLMAALSITPLATMPLKFFTRGITSIFKSGAGSDATTASSAVSTEKVGTDSVDVKLGENAEEGVPMRVVRSIF